MKALRKGCISKLIKIDSVSAVTKDRTYTGIIKVIAIDKVAKARIRHVYIGKIKKVTVMIITIATTNNTVALLVVLPDSTLLIRPNKIMHIIAVILIKTLYKSLIKYVIISPKLTNWSILTLNWR